MEIDSDRSMIACCGLDCSTCGIRLSENDPERAERLTREFRKMGFTDLQPESFRCDGCRGNRSKHWAANCQILKCCLDDKGLEYCSQCEDFACAGLEEWADKNDRHHEGLNRLVEMRAQL